MLSYGITALQLMPEESTSGLVIITDGILDVPNLPAFEAVMRQIRARIISCSFVQIGAMSNGQQSSYKKTSKARITSLGHVPNEELLRFISLSTFGSFIHFDLGHINGESALLTRLFSERLNAASYCKRLDNFQNELLSWGNDRLVFALDPWVCLLGFHKAVGEHHSTASKRTTNGWSLTFDEENARRRLDKTLKRMSILLIDGSFLVETCPVVCSFHTNWSIRLSCKRRWKMFSPYACVKVTLWNVFKFTRVGVQCAPRIDRVPLLDLSSRWNRSASAFTVALRHSNLLHRSISMALERKYSNGYSCLQGSTRLLPPRIESALSESQHEDDQHSK